MKNVAIMVGKKTKLDLNDHVIANLCKNSTVKRTHKCKREKYKVYITRHILRMQGVY